MFHGQEYTTRRGSTYNSYLIKDEKIALIVINHTEQDHAGSLSNLMEKKPETPIYCTKNGAMMIKKHFHEDWNEK